MIESIEERLKAARQQVADLEALLHRLKQEEEENNQNKQRAQKQLPVPNNNNNNNLIHDESESSSFLQGSTLQLIVEWLSPLELVRCLLVSKRWKEEIDRPLIWKQAGSRAIPSDLWNAMNILEESPQPQSILSTKTTTSSYYKKMLMAIVGEKPRRQVDIIAERQATSKGIQNYWLPSTTLISHKVFLMVDVYWKETGEIFGSWYKSFAQWVPSESDLGFQMIDYSTTVTATSAVHHHHHHRHHHGNGGGRGESSSSSCSSHSRGAAVRLPAPPLQGRLDDHFSEFYNPDPTTDVPTYIYDSISFSFRCLRTDTGESLHLGTDQDFDQYDTVLWAYLDTDIGAPTARNDAGCRARELWSLKNFQRGGVCLRFNVRPIPPPPTTRDDENHNDDNTTTTTTTAIHSWHGTTYLLDGLECDFVAYRQDGSYEDFKSLRELLISLDGFLWT